MRGGKNVLSKLIPKGVSLLPILECGKAPLDIGRMYTFKDTDNAKETMSVAVVLVILGKDSHDMMDLWHALMRGWVSVS